MPRKSRATRNPFAPEPRKQARFLNDLIERLAVVESSQKGHIRRDAIIDQKHAKWLAHGLRRWQAGKISLEQALGLNAGRGAPKKPLKPNLNSAWLLAVQDRKLTWTQIAGKVNWTGRPNDLGAEVRRQDERLRQDWVARTSREMEKK